MKVTQKLSEALEVSFEDTEIEKQNQDVVSRLLETPKFTKFLKAVILIDDFCYVSLVTASLMNMFHPSDGEVKQILLRLKENSGKLQEITQGFEEAHKDVKQAINRY